MTNEERIGKLYDDLQRVVTTEQYEALFLAYADEIRRECAEKAWDYVALKATSQTFGMGLTKHDMESAITGKEVGK